MSMCKLLEVMKREESWWGKREMKASIFEGGRGQSSTLIRGLCKIH